MNKILLLLISACLLSTANAASIEQLSRVDNKLELSKPSPYRADDNHIIHMGIFYTRDLLDSMTTEDINAYVERQIDAANMVMENSGLAIRREVIYIGEYPSDNQPDLPINSFLSTVYNQENQLLRDASLQYGFDYITVLRPHTDQNYCGWAFYNNPYAVMEIGGNCTSATLGAHEWGHNDGADHDIANSSDTPAKEYGRGFNCGGEGTIMSTSNNWFNRHNFYSTPEISKEGQQCGDDEKANIVRMLNELKEMPQHLGNRQDLPEKLAYVAFESSEDIVTTEGESIKLNLTLVDENGVLITLDRDVSIEVFTKSDSAMQITDYEPLAQRIIFNAGENKKEITLQTLSDSHGENEEAFYVGIRFGDAVLTNQENIKVKFEKEDDVIGYQFLESDVTIEELQTTNVTLERTGNLTNSSTVNLLTLEPWISLSTNTVTFDANQSIAEVSISILDIDENASGTISLALENGDFIADAIAIHGAIKKESKSSGGSIPFLSLLLLSLIISVKSRRSL